MRSTPARRPLAATLLLAALGAASCRTMPRQGAPAHAPVAAPAGASVAATVAPARLVYPATRCSDDADVFHGVTVPDPYRWLEDEASAETRAWIEAQNALTSRYLSGIAGREAIRARLTELWNFERNGIPRRKGGRYLLSRNDGLQNQSVLYVADRLDATPRVLVDPNAMSADGTVALAGSALSDDGRLLAYGVSDAGSDWTTWRVKDVDSGRDLPDVVSWVKFAGARWTKDGAGFFYGRFAPPKPGEELKGANRFHRLHYHRLGTPQEDDPLIYDRPEDGALYLSCDVTEDGRWLLIGVRRGTERKHVIQVAPLDRNPAEARPVVRELIGGFDAAYGFAGNAGTTFWFLTDKDAPRGRVIAVDAGDPSRSRWKTVVPEAAERLTDASYVGGRLVLSYLKDARSVVRVHERDGRLVREVALPGLGTASGFSGDPDDPETFFSFTSFAEPGAIWRHDVGTGESTVFRSPKLGFSPDGYETTQVFYTSRDGTRVPMFLTRRKGVRPDGTAPVLLYGYGGFDIAITPAFSVPNLVWMEMGGVFASANLRGGGEYGEAWHRAGMKLAKQNVFDDFIAAAEWLVANRWARPGGVATLGRSNGGLLVGATMIQRPDLFGACVPAVGVMDMLRFHKFTVGWGWIPEYGSPEVADEFRVLHAYSPYHRLKDGRYPPTLILTADHDDRVVPAHSFKFAAALQRHQQGGAPVLVRIETRAGHGAGKPTPKQIEEAADQLAFLAHTLGIPAPR
jgi:prolyl oligopeptidase